MAIKVVTSEDNIDYNALEIPADITISNILYGGSPNFPDGYDFIHVYAPCEEIRTKCLPLDANPREPTRADVVNKMSETLDSQPDRFHHWNNGITIVCEDASYDSAANELTITFNEGEGICNGGHTYFSIVTKPTAIDGQALVHLELVKLPGTLNEAERRQVITDIANKRNRNRALALSSQADHLGYYKVFQDLLGEKAKYVAWHEGDSSAEEGAIKSDLFIRMLACLDPLWFSHDIHNTRGSNHRQAATGSKGLNNKWFDGVEEGDPDQSLQHMAVLAADQLELVDQISYSIEHDDWSDASGRWRGTSFYDWLGPLRLLTHAHSGRQGKDLPAPALVMLLGTFRSNIWLSKDVEGLPNYVGYLEKPIELWGQTRADLMTSLLSLFEDGDRDPGHFIKQNAPYENQLIKILYGRMPPKFPKVFYDLNVEGDKYEASDSPTHYLENSGDEYFLLHELGGSGLPTGAEGYVKL